MLIYLPHLRFSDIAEIQGENESATEIIISDEKIMNKIINDTESVTETCF